MLFIKIIFYLILAIGLYVVIAFYSLLCISSGIQFGLIMGYYFAVGLLGMLLATYTKLTIQEASGLILAATVLGSPLFIKYISNEAICFVPLMVAHLVLVGILFSQKIDR